MIHRRREGECAWWGINYNFSKGTIFQIIIRIPLPRFVKRKYIDLRSESGCVCWQYYNLQMGLRLRRGKHWKLKDRFTWYIRSYRMPIHQRKEDNKYIDEYCEDVEIFIPFLRKVTYVGKKL